MRTKLCIAVQGEAVEHMWSCIYQLEVALEFTKEI